MAPKLRSLLFHPAFALGPLCLALAVLLGRQLQFPPSKQSKWDHVHITLGDEEGALRRFADTLTFVTVSSVGAQSHLLQPTEMEKMRKHLEKGWPRVFKTLTVRRVNEHSLLFKWEGSKPEKLPALFISHQDVVAAGSEHRWTHPPFGGVISDGFVWGRGALDVKITLTALLEAVDHLLVQGLVPERTLYLAFGHDEEVGGIYGAKNIAEELTKEGVRLEFIMDEGGTVLSDGLAGITKVPVALVGMAEKVTRNYLLDINGTGGHTMTPPSLSESAVNKLARVITRLDKGLAKPTLPPPTVMLLHALALGAKSKLIGFALYNAHIWPLRILLARVLDSHSPELKALTISSHVINNIGVSPPGNNIVPAHVTANINVRILPGTDEHAFMHTIQDSVQQACGTKCVLSLQGDTAGNSSQISAVDNLGFRNIQQAAHETLQGPRGLVVAPYLMLGRTDSVHYTHLTDNIFRFMPFHMNKTAGDVQRVHGVDERVGTQDYLQGVKFYIRMLQLSIT